MYQDPFRKIAEQQQQVLRDAVASPVMKDLIGQTFPQTGVKNALELISKPVWQPAVAPAYVNPVFEQMRQMRESLIGNVTPALLDFASMTASLRSEATVNVLQMARNLPMNPTALRTVQSVIEDLYGVPTTRARMNSVLSSAPMPADAPVEEQAGLLIEGVDRLAESVPPEPPNLDAPLDEPAVLWTPASAPTSDSLTQPSRTPYRDGMRAIPLIIREMGPLDPEAAKVLTYASVPPVFAYLVYVQIAHPLVWEHLEMLLVAGELTGTFAVLMKALLSGRHGRMR